MIFRSDILEELTPSVGSKNNREPVIMADRESAASVVNSRDGKIRSASASVSNLLY